MIHFNPIVPTYDSRSQASVRAGNSVREHAINAGLLNTGHPENRPLAAVLEAVDKRLHKPYCALPLELRPFFVALRQMLDDKGALDAQDAKEIVAFMHDHGQRFGGIEQGLQDLVGGMIPQLSVSKTPGSEKKLALLEQHARLRTLTESELVGGLKAFLNAPELKDNLRLQRIALRLAMLHFKRVPTPHLGEMTNVFLNAGMSVKQLEALMAQFGKFTMEHGGDGAVKRISTVFYHLVTTHPHAALTAILAAPELKGELKPLVELAFDLPEPIPGHPMGTRLLSEFLPLLAFRIGGKRRGSLLAFAQASGALHVAAELPKSAMVRKDAETFATNALKEGRLADLPHVARLLSLEQLPYALSACASILDPVKRRARLMEFQKDCWRCAPELSMKAGELLIHEGSRHPPEDGLSMLGRKTPRGGK